MFEPDRVFIYNYSFSVFLINNTVPYYWFWIYYIRLKDEANNFIRFGIKWNVGLFRIKILSLFFIDRTKKWVKYILGQIKVSIMEIVCTNPSPALQTYLYDF